MGWQATLSNMIACPFLMHNPMGWSPAYFIPSTTEGYSHSPPVPCFAVIPVIRHAARWWNPSRTLIISLVTNHISLPYKSTDCNTALYIAPQACTVSPVLYSTLANIPYRLQDFCKFW